MKYTAFNQVAREQPQEYVEIGQCCDDCAIAIANDDYTGMSEKQEDATREGTQTHRTVPLRWR